MKSLQNIAEEMDIDNMKIVVDGKDISKDDEEESKDTESALKNFEDKVNEILSEE